jgi:hypothetical protein
MDGVNLIKIQCKHLCVTMFPLYNYNMLIIKKILL